MILSVSRRTDIPAFYSKWFINRVREGFVYVRNPFIANQISNISLGKDIVDCIVFWSKNPAPLLEFLPEINKKYNGAFYFQYTLNPYENELEPGLPILAQRIDTFKRISDIYGSERVVWRYDPILLSNKYTIDWHKEQFQKLYQEIKPFTDTCVISFIDMYDKTVKNTKPYGISSLSNEEMNILASSFASSAVGSGLTIKTCAEGIDLRKYGIEPNSCIDQNRIEKIIGCELKAKPDNQRENCHCIECADIGIYNTCLHGCRYCYANFNETLVKQAVSSHDDRSPLLTGSLSDSCIVKNYSKAKSLKAKKHADGQLRLF